MSKQIASLIREHCIIKSQANEYMLGKLPGTRYRSIYHLSNILYHPQYLDWIITEMADLIDEKLGGGEAFDDIQIAGREWSSIPLITGLQAHTGVHGFMIRRERKTYGDHNLIEGQPISDLPVLLVDDLANSTNSFAYGKAVCESMGLKVLPFCFAVLNKYEPGMKDWDKDRYSGQEIISICHGGDLNT